jgi:hypothetical protein
MIYKDRHERKLISALSELSFSLTGITPFQNADKFYFYRKDSKDLLNIEIIFNGQGYCLSLGKNNQLKPVNMKFELTWETMLKEVVKFAGGK